MIQLNKTNGHIIKIDDYTKKTGKVVFTEFENILFNDNGTIKKEFISKYQNTKILNVDYSKLSDGSLTDEENILKRFYEALKLELGDEYVISYDIQNWLYSERPMRILILNKLILQELKPTDNLGTLSPMGQIIERVKVQHYGFYKDISDDTTFIVYVDTITEEDYPIILPFLNTSIWSDNKII
jgi:hypothetical protein